MIRRDNREEYLRELEQADQTEDLTQFIEYVANCCRYSLNLYLTAARGNLLKDADDIDREIGLFRHSLMNASDETLLTKDYIVSVLHPFYDYCQSKIGQFSDMFGRVRTRISIFTTAVDGHVINLCEDSTIWPSFSDKSEIPAEVRSVSFRSSTYLTTFQGSQNNHVLIQVTNEADAYHCQWTFSIGVPNFHLDYDGRDLQELKKRFNEIVRTMMKHLEQSRT